MAERNPTKQARLLSLQKIAAKNAATRGGLVLGAEQAHAFAMSLTLHKIKGIEDLTDNNYASWSKQVRGALDVISFKPFLKDIYYEDMTIAPEINDINRK
ncbi:hypothetical protein PTTG_30501, partial [Puccinia triticina 1-1 BBBD Race 1]